MDIGTAACPLSHCTPVFPKEGSHTEAPITLSEYSFVSGLPSDQVRVLGRGEREGAEEER